MVLERAVKDYGAPLEVLSDNSLAFNQLRQGGVGSVEIFLASRGTMPISGLPGKPTPQGKNERSHQTLIRFLDANQPSTLEQLRTHITRFREHYNNHRPHQALKQATPREAWELLEHTPATEPIPLAFLETKAAQYRQVRRLRQSDLGRSQLTTGKDGQLPEPATTTAGGQHGADQALVEVTAANTQVYYEGYHVSLPTTFARRQFYRTITDDEFLLLAPESCEDVFSFPLPMIALQVQGRYVASYGIQGAKISNPSKHWERELAEFQDYCVQRQEQLPEVFDGR